MDKSELLQAARPESLVEAVSRYRPPAHQHHGGGPMETVREATYRGHRIVVRTSYELQVDGRPVTGHLGVTNDGQVHYHPVPNLSFSSALDLVRNLIDVFPDDFPTNSDSPPDEHSDTHPDPHSGMHSHGPEA